MGTDVAVVIGNYQGEHLLPDCLASLNAQTQPPAEVIVVDAGSTDASVPVARQHDARVLQHSNRGLGYLYNRGADAATSSLVLFLNNDVALEQGCVEQLASALAAEPSRFAADAHQLDWEGLRTIHARTTLSRGHLLREYLPGFTSTPSARPRGSSRRFPQTAPPCSFAVISSTSSAASTRLSSWSGRISICAGGRGFEAGQRCMCRALR